MSALAAWPLVLLLLVSLGGGPVVPAFAGEQESDAENGSEEGDGADQTGDSTDRSEQNKNEQDKNEKKVPPSRSFTDEDLERYHRPRPAPDPEEAGNGEAGGEKKSARAPQAPPREIRPHAPLVRTPLKVATPPSRDPIKKFRDREAREKFRTDQILGLRDRITRLEARLQYLRQKRIAIVDPLNLMPRAPAGEDTSDEAGLKPQQLLERVEAEITVAETELATVRENLVEIETRFGHEANLP
jgi:hypothetical protein